jgi:hypothetical protein
MIGCHCATQWHMTTIMKLTNNEVPNNGYILGSFNDHDKFGYYINVKANLETI